ncbi:MAG: hypothetical protein H7Z15_18805 [Rhizobacter sp.]|nr:hypothetical protein [Rhizobacter sp.]
MMLARMVVFNTWHASSRYERYQRLAVLEGDVANIPFHGEDFARGGALRALASSTYYLEMDGVRLASTTVMAGATSGSFNLALANINQGWHLFEVTSTAAAAETCPRWFMFVDRGQALGTLGTPVASGSYDVAHRNTPHHYALLPAGTRPSASPLVPRTCPAFNTAVPRAQLFRENITPTREGNINRLNNARRGYKTTFNRQAYFWSDAVMKQPRVALLDGPRNVGNFVMPTHVMTTRQGGAYFADPWRVGRVDPDGTVTTRAGYRHRDIDSYWEHPQNLELLGDWSSIPTERRGFHEIWGLAWDQTSLATDPSALPIEGERPHLAGPRLFVTDTQNNRIVLLSFKHNTHEPPVVTEFLTGLQDPWDVVWVDGLIYVSERTAHRIAAYDARTGQFRRVVVQGLPLATIDTHREVRRVGTLEQIRAQPCVGPEGLFYQDGWLYFGAKANGQVRRVNLESGVIEVVCAPLIDDNSHYVKIAVSDGTFGPKGTVFTWTWSISNFGMPEAFLPGGQRWAYNAFDRVSRGKGGAWESLGYASAGCVSQGRLLTGSSAEGLIQISLAASSDPAPDITRYYAGMTAFIVRGHNLIHGHHGYGFHGMPLPWGELPEIDYYLRWNGHTPPV